MSLYQEVAEAALRRGSATAEDLQPQFQHLTLKQIEKALNNAVWHGLIVCVGRAPRVPGVTGTPPGIYGMPAEDDDEDGWPKPMPFDATPNWVRPSVSVWEYAQRAANSNHRRAA
jgi:hypothetical protein